MHDKERSTLRVRMGCVCFTALLTRLALAAVLAAFAVPGRLSAQAEVTGSTWTFSTDGANNLVIQDLEAFSTTQGVVGEPLCLRYHPVCPSASDRRAADLRMARPRYTLRSTGAKRAEWRVEPGQPLPRETGVVLPFQVGVLEQGMVQIVSSPGPWSVNLQRIPAAELRVGDGKRWNVFLSTQDAPADGGGCWIEVSCPLPGS